MTDSFSLGSSMRSTNMGSSKQSTLYSIDVGIQEFEDCGKIYDADGGSFLTYY